MQRATSLRGFAALIYTQNPFYLLSACLVLYGLQAAFHPPAGELIDPWALLSSLCGYTLVLAVTAFLIVRFGRVWEDARSLILLLLLMFLAVSVSFDEIVNSNPNQGKALLLFGFCFSTLISAGLIRGLKIGFPLLFRIPYYLLLALFFAYPPFVSPEITELPRTAIAWRLIAFPTIAGFVFLGLIPAVRRTAAYVRDNGTPWSWPWFPWTVFGFLAFAVCLRAYVLSIAFDASDGMDSVFGFYQLVPFLLAGLVLLLEIGLVERRASLQRFVMVSAPVLILLAIPGNGGSFVYRQFLGEFIQRFGSPLFLTVGGLIPFYGYAWFRRVRFAEAGMISMLLLMSMIGPRTIDVRTLIDPVVWPLVIIGCMELVQAWIQRDSLRWFVGLSCLNAAVTVAVWNSDWFGYRKIIPYHLFLFSILIVGGVFRDRFARLLRISGALLLPVTALVVLLAEDPASVSVSTSARIVYVAGLVLFTFAYWQLVKDLWYFVAGLVMVAGGFVAFVWAILGALQRGFGSRGFGPVMAGIACFGIAALISAFKGGLGQRLKRGQFPVDVPPDDG